MNGDRPEISLYFHIPFCTRKCDYCHFYVIPDKDPFKKQLMHSLHQEWLSWLPEIQNKTVTTIYFGGGTPSLLGAEAIGKIVEWIRCSSVCLSPDLEITLEANPENISRHLMEQFFEVGVNRISIGIQSFNDDLLKILSRQHSAQKAIEAILHTAESGLTNISIDLMYDLPSQSLESWMETLSTACSLPITHLSLYNLTIEPYTSFYKKRDALKTLLPEPESSLAMYESAVDKLQEQGLMQYEISAFAKANFQSRHNMGYWKSRPFLGFGPSAFSYWGGKRFRNVANLNRYSQKLEDGESPVDFEEELSGEAKKRELVAVQLRMISGVDLVHFQEVHGMLDEAIMNDLERLHHEGFLARKHSHYSLTKQGILFYDTVATELV